MPVIFRNRFPVTEPKESSPNQNHQQNQAGSGAQPQEGAFSRLPLSCSVELSTTAQGRQRDLCASIQIPCGIEPVWKILTSYDRLAEVIPSLQVSRRLPHPEGENKVRLEQVGSQRFLNRIDFSARVVLDMEEDYPHKLTFAMVEGDFKMMKGCWMLESLDVDGQAHTRLSYCLTVLPKLTMPIKLIEKRLSQDLAQNLEAIYRQAIANEFGNNAFAPA